MSKKRANGEGSIRKRKDGRWEGRYTAGYDKDGKVITKNVLGKTQAEVKEKLKTVIEESQKLDPTRTGQYSYGINRIPKEYLIDFVCSSRYICAHVQSEKQREIEMRFLKTYKSNKGVSK